MNSITFDNLVKKFEESEKDFGNKISYPSGDTICLSQKYKNQSLDSSIGEGSKRGCGRNNFKGKAERYFHGERSDVNCIYCRKNGSHEKKT